MSNFILGDKIINMQKLIDKVSTLAHCTVYSPNGIPEVQQQHLLPEDLKVFYQICGGISLLEN